MTWSWKLARVAGIDLYVHATFFMVIAWIALVHWNQSHRIQAVVEGVGFILALFACIVLHELGHALTARRYGIRTRDITLLPIGGVARLERMPDEPIQELWVALAGPAVNVVIALLLFVWLQASGLWESVDRLGVAIGGFAERIMIANVFLAGFNLLPAFPMDGGRVLRALLATRMEYTRATQRAALIGQGMAICFRLRGTAGQSHADLHRALRMDRRRSGGEHGADEVLARRDPRPPSDAHPLSDPDSREYAGRCRGSAPDRFAAGFSGRQRRPRRGYVDAERPGRGADARWQECTCRRPYGAECATAEASEMLETVLARLQGRDCHTVPITERGALIGLVTMDNVGEFLMVQAAERKSLPAVPAP